MTTKNDITGDEIKSKTSNENFEKGFGVIDWSVKMEATEPKKPQPELTGTT